MRRNFGIFVGLTALFFVALFVFMQRSDVKAEAQTSDKPADKNSANQPAVPVVFDHWPKDKKPDFAIVVTAQTWGYLRPCGCSQKQLGGLERRQNMIDQLKAKGWPVTAVDLGEIAPQTGLPDQIALKYKTMMMSLKQMGYIAVGVGKSDFANDLDRLTGMFSLQPGNESPRLLAANLKRASAPNQALSFPTGANQQPYIGDVTVGKVGNFKVGVASCIESSNKMKEDLGKLTKEFELLDNRVILKNVKTKLDLEKPNVRVLLFQGGIEAAQKAAEMFTEYDIVVCQSDDPLPPLTPVKVNNGKTSLIHVGHKGQYAGVVGVFKQPDGSFKTEYQLIELSEEYVTPKTAEAEQKHEILKMLQQYADEVKNENFLEKAIEKKVMHNAQLRHDPMPKFVGSAACKECHPNESEIWEKSKHAEALSALENPKLANRPTGRNHDPECVICHTVGFEYKTGFTTKEKTPHLQHVGCENCHGPGSAHVADPKNKDLYVFLSHWKTKPGEKLPSKAAIEEIGKTEPSKRSIPIGKLSIDELKVAQAVSKACMHCHDPENDPKFDLYDYMPKVWHSGFKAVTPGSKPAK